MLKDNSTTFNTASRTTNVNRNMLVAGFSVVIPALLVFLSRKIFLDTLNLHYLGLNETFTSILGSLTLTELGFQSAVLYNLYKPIQENDTQKVNRLISILRIIFNWIGVVFIVVPLLFTPFLGYVLKGVEVTPMVRFYFLVVACTSAVSYFLSYPRCLLQADQKDYVVKCIDLLIQIVFVSLQIIVLLCWQSFLWFLLLNIIKSISSNLLVHLYCKRKYKFLQIVPFDKVLFKGIWNNAKNIFVGRIAGVVYNSIDNILISTFISTIAVGGFANYATISTMIKTACYRLFPIGNIIGHMMADDSLGKNYYELIFRVYTLVKSVMANLVLIPLLLLFNPFVTLWLGEEYLFSQTIVFLIVFDMYAFFLTNPLGDFIFAKGLFDLDKKIALLGLLVNVLSSLFLVQILGIEGVLLGTAFSQIVLWIGRCLILYRYAIVSKMKLYRYVYTQIYYIFVFILIYLFIKDMGCIMHFVFNSYLDLILTGLIVDVVIVVLTIVSYNRLEEFRFLIAKFKK